MRTPRELIEIYWERIYNEGQVELVREVCADPILRHDPGFTTPLTHDEQIVRITRALGMKPVFTHQVLHADDEHVTSVWNMRSQDGRDTRLCGIEVFRARDGRFTDCWNSSYMAGGWSEGARFDPTVLPPPALVGDLVQIDARWVEQALQAGGAVPVQRVATPPVITPIGHGTTGATARIRVAYNDGVLTAPTSMVCKIGLPLQSMNAVSPFERERRAYALFGAEGGVPFRVPTLLFGGIDDTGLSNLLLEDLSARARPGDQIAGCSVEEAGAVVRELALLHRHWLHRPELLRQDWLLQPEPLLPMMQRGIAVLHRWFGSRLGADEFVMIDRFGELAAAWLARPVRRRTLVHNDPRVDNVLFERTDAGVRACLIDWQGFGAGDPLHDVAYFLSGSLDPDDRRGCERDLLAQYGASMRAADAGFHDAAIEHAYRCSMPSGLWFTLVAAAAARPDGHGGRLVETLLHRNLAAVADWNALETIG